MPISAKTQFTDHYEIIPHFIPAAGETVADFTCWIRELHLTNPTATGRTVTIADRQGNPVPLLGAVEIDAGGEYHRQYEGLMMVNGFTAVAAASDSVTIRCRYSK